MTNLEKKTAPLPNFKTKIYYEDTDFTGFVYHSNYLKFCERAREQAMSHKVLVELYSLGIHSVVRSAFIEYVHPALFGSELTIQSQVTFSKSPRIIFKQVIFEEAKKTRVCSVKIDLCMINKKGRPIRLPDPIYKRFESFI